jgi:enoyl-CoA hydratase/carnithine racemase
VRVVILTGSGDKAFAAGADIGEIAALDEVSGRDFSRRGQRTFDAIESLGKPVIAAVKVMLWAAVVNLQWRARFAWHRIARCVRSTGSEAGLIPDMAARSG